MGQVRHWGFFRRTNEFPKAALKESGESGHLAHSLHGLDEGAPVGATPPNSRDPRLALLPHNRWSAGGASVLRGFSARPEGPAPAGHVPEVGLAAMASENCKIGRVKSIGLASSREPCMRELRFRGVGVLRRSPGWGAYTGQGWPLESGCRAPGFATSLSRRVLLDGACSQTCSRRPSSVAFWRSRIRTGSPSDEQQPVHRASACGASISDSRGWCARVGRTHWSWL